MRRLRAPRPYPQAPAVCLTSATRFFGTQGPRVSHAAWLLLLPLLSLVAVFSLASFGGPAAGGGAQGGEGAGLSMLAFGEGGDPRAVESLRVAREAQHAARPQSQRSVRDKLPLSEVIARAVAEEEGDEEDQADVVDVGDEALLAEGEGGTPRWVLPYDEDPRSRKVADKPKSYLFAQLLSDEEADALVRLATPTMLKSTVVDSATGKSVDSNIRTSSGTFLTRGQNELVRRVEEKIANYSRVPMLNGEGLQILHYEFGQKYEAHFDYFHDRFNTAPEKGGQRLATVLMYLSDVQKGGETVFPHSLPKPDYGALEARGEFWSDCAKRGAAVKPRKGDALLFFSLDENERVDTTSLHAGCPVIEGNKWSATKWMHIHEFGQGTKHARQHKNGKGCVDDDKSCVTWAAAGECEKNPSFMTGPEGACQKSCGHCHT